MKFKKVMSRSIIVSYQCYESGTVNSGKRIAMIDEPLCSEKRKYSDNYIVTFVGGSANGEAYNLLKIVNKIKKISKSYRDQP